MPDETANSCGLETPSGQLCAYPATRCPRHSTPPPPVTPPPGKAPSLNLHDIAARALASAIALDANPLQTSRLVRAVRSAQALGNAPADEDALYKELEIRGRLMTGLPPRTDAEWYRLAEFLDDEAILEVETWALNVPDSIPPWGFHPQDVWVLEDGIPLKMTSREAWHAAFITSTGELQYIHPTEIDLDYPGLPLIPEAARLPEYKFDPDRHPNRISGPPASLVHRTPSAQAPDFDAGPAGESPAEEDPYGDDLID